MSSCTDCEWITAVVDSAFQPPKPFLNVCAAGVAPEAHRLITAAQLKGGEISAVATPQGGFLDTDAIEARTG